MGRHRYPSMEEYFSDGLDKCDPNRIPFEDYSESPHRTKLKKKHKRSRKPDNIEPKVSGNESGEVVRERRKHRHRHKRHKRDDYKNRGELAPEEEGNEHHRKKRSRHSSSQEEHNRNYYEENEPERTRRRSAHRKRNKHRNYDDQSINDIKRERDSVYMHQRSKWQDNDVETTRQLISIKTEPITDSDEDLPTNSRNSTAPSDTNENSVPSASVKQEPDGEAGNSEAKQEDNKAKVNFGLSGKLTEDANTYNGIVIKYSQPPEARKPKRRWRWYIFKGDQELPFLPLHRQSAYLIGRERKVADIPTDHPSCSKQHAVLQYRLVSYDREDGSTGRTVKPYILDLGSANGTYVNNRRIDAKRYVELLEKDVVKFGYSSREYVLLHEASKGSEDDLPDTGPELSPYSLLQSI